MRNLGREAPALRFPEFSGAWPERRGGDVFTQRRERGRAGLPIYSVTIDSGMVRRDSLEREIGSNAGDEANLAARQGDIVYNMMRMWQGAMGRAPKDCMVSPAYVVLAPKPGTSPAFFEHWFKRARSIYWLWAYSYGLTNDRLRLYFRDFAKVPMRVPEPAEQAKIAAFLGCFDERLALLEQERRLLIAAKAGMVQRIFSQAVRFQREDGSAYPDWRRKTIGQLYEWVATNNLSRDMLSDVGPGVQNIHYGDIHRRFPARFRQSQETIPFIKPGALSGDLKATAFCQPGDVIIADASEDYADIGKAIEIIEAEPNSLVAGLHTLHARLRTEEVVVGFAAQLFQSSQLRRQIWRVAQGISVLGLSKPHLAKLGVAVPHPDEQRHIADVLGAFDEKIAAVGQRLEQVRKFKLALLQQMFV